MAVGSRLGIVHGTARHHRNLARLFRCGLETRDERGMLGRGKSLLKHQHYLRQVAPNQGGGVEPKARKNPDQI